MATGVLPIFLGRATRAVSFFESAEKEYLAHFRPGVVTNTQDTEGQILHQSDVRPSRADIENALPVFTGEIQQIPPMFSAIKIGGQKLYDLARQGKEVERPPRTIRIFSLSLGEITPEGDYPLAVHCSKGTYVRTLCHDLGEHLGCGGCMSALRRTRAGCFSLADAHTMDEILHSPAPDSLVLPVDRLFSHLPAAELTDAQERACRHGNPIAGWTRGGDRWRVYSRSGEFLMVGRYKNGLLYTEKSFFEVNGIDNP